MEFHRGGQAIQRIRRERRLTQEQLADKAGITSNTVSRIERGLLVPALPTLVDICNALETGADSVLAAYITADTPIRWSALAQKFDGLDADKQDKIETILSCLIETL
jgi:transcriptional regulator with XRE-family HTH domain